MNSTLRLTDDEAAHLAKTAGLPLLDPKHVAVASAGRGETIEQHCWRFGYVPLGTTADGCVLALGIDGDEQSVLHLLAYRPEMRREFTLRKRMIVADQVGLDTYDARLEAADLGGEFPALFAALRSQRAARRGQ